MAIATTDSGAVPASQTSGILDLALGLLAEAGPSRGLLVDLPCGTGNLSVKAARAGWTVAPCDIDPAAFQGGDAVEVRRVDMNGPLPFEDASADAFACCEGIEHAENPWHLLREARRVLKPGGLAVFTIPNTVDLRQRLRILRRGYASHYFPVVPSHVNMMGTFALCHALLAADFSVLGVRTRRAYGGPLRIFAPLFRFRAACGLPDDVRIMLSSSRVLFGRDVAILARAAPRP